MAALDAWRAAVGLILVVDLDDGDITITADSDQFGDIRVGLAFSVDVGDSDQDSANLGHGVDVGGAGHRLG